MVTASHNPEPVNSTLHVRPAKLILTRLQDNGVKLVDPAGEMLDQSWEAHATSLANCPSTSSLISTFTTLAAHLHVDLAKPATIVFARDTRPTGPALIAAVKAALEVFEGSVKSVDLGITTTPVLHYVVKATNDKSGASGKPTEEGYFEKMSTAFKTLIVSFCFIALFQAHLS